MQLGSVRSGLFVCLRDSVLSQGLQAHASPGTSLLIFIGNEDIYSITLTGAFPSPGWSAFCLLAFAQSAGYESWGDSGPDKGQISWDCNCAVCFDWRDQPGGFGCSFFPHLFLNSVWPLYRVFFQADSKPNGVNDWTIKALSSLYWLWTQSFLEMVIFEKSKPPSPGGKHPCLSETCTFCNRCAVWPWRKQTLLGFFPPCSVCEFNILFIFLASGFVGIWARRSCLRYPHRPKGLRFR